MRYRNWQMLCKMRSWVGGQLWVLFFTPFPFMPYLMMTFDDPQSSHRGLHTTVKCLLCINCAVNVQSDNFITCVLKVNEPRCENDRVACFKEFNLVIRTLLIYLTIWTSLSCQVSSKHADDRHCFFLNWLYKIQWNCQNIPIHYMSRCHVMRTWKGTKSKYQITPF